MTSLGVLLSGSRGRMGCFARSLLEDSDGFHVATEVQRGDDLEEAIRNTSATLGLDLTRSGLGFAHGQAMLAGGLRPVIGTSGVRPDEVQRLDALARERSLGGLVVPNFSLGFWLLEQAVRQAAAHMSACEIIELHRPEKADAPSGSARKTRRLVQALHPGLEVPIHSVRLPGTYAHQEVLFGAPGELLTLRHDMQGPEAFGPGILAALRFAARAQGVKEGIDCAFTEDSSLS